MFGRVFILGGVYVLLGLPLAGIIIHAENQTPWLIALGIYFVFASLIVNSYCSIDGEGKELARGVRWLFVSWAVVLTSTIGYLAFTGQLFGK